jgi:hypothetical protein
VNAALVYLGIGFVIGGIAAIRTDVEDQPGLVWLFVGLFWPVIVAVVTLAILSHWIRMAMGYRP